MSASLFAELAASVRAVAARTGPAVVAIGRHRRGSGIVIAPGYVMSNAHNLRDRTTLVTFDGGRSVQGTVTGVDPDGDLAVLAVDTDDAPSLDWSDHTVEQGDVVFAAAPAFTATRVTVGFVTLVGRAFRGPRGRPITGSIEHSAPLARGSSGGPLLDADGRLVGLNTHRLGDGFTVALPTDADLRRRVDALTRGDAPQHLRLGVAVAPAHVALRLRRAVGLPDRSGLLVRGVEEGSPAESAGIRPGDLLLSADGHELATPGDLHALLDARTPSGSITVHLVRGIDELTLTVELVAPAGGD